MQEKQEGDTRLRTLATKKLEAYVYLIAPFPEPIFPVILQEMQATRTAVDSLKELFLRAPNDFGFVFADAELTPEASDSFLPMQISSDVPGTFVRRIVLPSPVQSLSVFLISPAPRLWVLS